MAFKVDAAGRKYCCCRGHDGTRFVIYCPIRYWGDWVVTKHGLENFKHYYPIEKRRLWESDWHDHISSKEGWGVVDFDKALAYAQRIHAQYKPKDKQDFISMLDIINDPNI